MAITTAEQLLHAGDIGRCELIRGKLVMMSPAGEEHGGIANKVAFLLTRVVEAHGLGRVYAAETGFQIASAPDTVRAPDVAFVSRKRLAKVPPGKGFRRGSPDLAVEVVSPGDTVAEVQEKVQDWLRSGAIEAWVVDPADRTIAVHRTSEPVKTYAGTDELTAEDLLPGLRLRVADAFA